MFHINLPWGQLPDPNSFAGGDLQGIQKELPYLQELGINALYLTPIFKSVSNHKYDIQDYFTVDAMFGTNEDFADLVDAAHAKNIRVVIDAVFNHVSDQCSQFQDVLMTKLKKDEPALHLHRVKVYAEGNVFCLERGDIYLRIDGNTYNHAIERLG